MTLHDDDVVTEAQLAARWKVKVRTLQLRRQRGEPFPIPFQQHPRLYRRAAIEAFEQAQEEANQTSESAKHEHP